MKNNLSTNTPDNTKLLDTIQTAKYLGITSDTLAVWRCNKIYNLQYIKVGKSVKYRVSDLDNFINSRVMCGAKMQNKSNNKAIKEEMKNIPKIFKSLIFYVVSKLKKLLSKKNDNTKNIGYPI
jgi:hypothetical protein